MLSLETLKETATRSQTTLENVLREYVQHLFLSELYRLRGSERLLFKGGTALRIVHQSPRFSEDLDFSGVAIRPGQIQMLVDETRRSLKRQGVDLTVVKAGATSGGYLAELAVSLHGHEVRILLEVSLRARGRPTGEPVLISSDFLPAYTILVLANEQLVGEKIQATLERKKPRDFFDVYFILRHNLLPVGVRGRLRPVLAGLGKSQIHFGRELKSFLPRNFHHLLKNFPNLLKNELRKFKI